MATGYDISYPFLSENTIPLSKSDFNLYKFMFYPGLKHPKTLAFISLSLPAGAILPMGELQCRWFVLLMANKSKLPDRDRMWKSIQGHKRRVSKRYADPVKHALECDWIPTMDWLANKVGVKTPISLSTSLLIRNCGSNCISDLHFHTSFDSKVFSVKIFH